MQRIVIGLALMLIAFQASAEKMVFYKRDHKGGVYTITERPATNESFGFKSNYELNDYASDCSKLGLDQDPLKFNTVPVTGDVQLDAILAVGSQIWKLVKDNAPIVEIKLGQASALPQGVQCWNQLENWQLPRAKEYTVRYVNGFGMDVIRYVFRLVYAYGGSHKDKGQYIANATIQNKDVFVVITNRLDVDVQIPQVLNIGTTEDPVAAMQITVGWRIRNIALPFADRAESVSFVLTGDGAPIQILD